MFSISRRIFIGFNLTKLSYFQHPKFSRRISLIATVNLAPPNSTKHYCSTILVSKMSQKSITSFFTRKAPVSTTAVTESSDGDGENIVKPVKPTTAEKKKASPKTTKKASPKTAAKAPTKTKKARKRIESSSDEENGSPKKESPEKTKTTAKKRKSSPSLSASKVSKKTKDEKEETEIKSEKEETETAKSDSSGEKKKQRRSQQERDA